MKNMRNLNPILLFSTLLFDFLQFYLFCCLYVLLNLLSFRSTNLKKHNTQRLSENKCLFVAKGHNIRALSPKDLHHNY